MYLSVQHWYMIDKSTEINESEETENLVYDRVALQINWSKIVVTSGQPSEQEMDSRPHSLYQNKC